VTPSRRQAIERTTRRCAVVLCPQAAAECWSFLSAALGAISRRSEDVAAARREARDGLAAASVWPELVVAAFADLVGHVDDENSRFVRS
jgi:hypothetical protein